MKADSPWTPRMAAYDGSPYERLVTALAEDIVDGDLPAGARMPAHRPLAARLGISVGTVTKAYAALERRGLVRGDHGRGTFVTYIKQDATDTVDLATNRPPPMLGDRVVGEALATVSRRLDVEGLCAYGPPEGLPQHQRAVASWIALAGVEFAAEDLVLCNGARHGLVAALLSASDSGAPAPVFTEEMCFPAMLTYAELAGHPVRGLPMDAEGMRPDALDRALAAPRRAPGRPIVYVTPTMQNPSTATMGRRRRRDIVAVARRRDAVIIEDDVYSLTHERHAPTLVELAPERTFYVTSASKALSAAIRVGALKPPPDAWDRTLAAVRALAQPVSPIQCDLLAELTRTGVATDVATAIRRESTRRTALARATLGETLRTGTGTGYRGFVPMATPLAASVVVAASCRGVELTDPATMMTDPSALGSGIRVCLGASSYDELARGLRIVAEVLDRVRGRGPRRDPV